MTLPRARVVMKGALVGFDLFNPLASVIVFQYTPDTLIRSLQASRTREAPTGRFEAMRLAGPPIETISMKADIDAGDQLTQPDKVTAATGIYPQLSALEMLLYPKTRVAIANTIALAAGGTREVIAPEAPLTLLVWGVKRVVPVQLTEFSITEEAYDTQLNPIRATVSLGLRVLTYSDLPLTHPGYWLFLTHQVAKEGMAVLASGANLFGIGTVLAAIGSGDVDLT